MSTWTTPATWANSAVTAAQMNTEIRDHLNFLKGALDILTNSTTADTSNTMFMYVKRSATTGSAYQAAVTADANARFIIAADGKLDWGPGSGAVDTNLYRPSAARLKTDHDFQVGGATPISLSPLGYLALTEIATPGTPATNSAYLYIDASGGITRLLIRWDTGVSSIISTS